MLFRDRTDAGRQLGQALKSMDLNDPLVLAIPRGGVITGAAIAREIGAELDVVLSRKIRAPYQPELAIGAIGEDGAIYLNHAIEQAAGASHEYLERERQHQVQEIARRQRLFRAVRPQASLKGRSVIITDDGIATGSTMVAAIHVARASQPREVIVAVPVAPKERIQAIGRLCDRVVCLMAPRDFWAVGQFYESFESVEDEEVVRILEEFAPARPPAS